jgi:Domain of unknown function (DUF1707)/FHA domain
MGGSAADTPATPEYLRASDAERDRAVSALRQEFAEGRLSHDTFMFRMSSALGARNRGQLAGLFTDLPPRRATLLARLRAAFLHRDLGPEGGNWYPGPGTPSGMWGPRAVPGDGERPPQPAGWSGAYRGPGGPGQPAPMVFPPGTGTRFTIGRRHDCDLRIADLSVSRLHAELERGEDGWLLADLGSHNGTRVNGWRVRGPVPVRAGDVLQFGSATFVIHGLQGPSGPLPEGPEDGESPPVTP